ncbi:MAG: hypothetical protein ACUVWX_11320, partial [Kiritimatiellia bacterium]
LFTSGLLLRIAPIPRRWPARLGSAFLNAAAILLVQTAVILLYRKLTAWEHDLPPILAHGVEWIARLAGSETAYGGRQIALFTMRKVHQLAPTWELLLDPVTACFFAGGITALLLRRKNVGLLVLRFVLTIAIWLPLRCGFLVGLFMHRALITDYDAPLRLMAQFWSPWLLLALAFVPIPAVMRISAAPAASVETPASAERSPLRAIVSLLLLAAGVAVVTLGTFWDPVGRRKAGRVLIDEYHSTWEPTTRPFDTTWYGHKSGYNYACLYDYCSRFYEMGRITNRIDQALLTNCDVLILKVPTAPYAAEEVTAIVKFVERGGGLLLIGEHTDVFLTSTHLNQVARKFGFEFRSDCLFGLEEAFVQRYRPPFVPHPAVRLVEDLDFAVSCSIRPQSWRGRAAILDTGLWSLPADYHASNFYPQVEDRADARYGAFIELWATRHGKGRILAFGDSTIFSNFSLFEPGKSELLLGVLEWLNHGNRYGDPRFVLWTLGLILVVTAVVVRPRSLETVLFLGTGLLAWAAVAGICRSHYFAVSLPRPVRPLTVVSVDRTISDALLSRCGFIQGTSQGFGIFEQWILRLGYFTTRRSGVEVFRGDLVIFFAPSRWPTLEFRSALLDYVANGGTVLVLDSALNEKSTANSLLAPFGLAFDQDVSLEGTLQTPEGWPAVPVMATRTIKGGEPFVSLDGRPVAAVARYGKGLVAGVGFGARFNDENMGVTTELEPDESLRRVFDLQFSLLRWLVSFATSPTP